MSIVPRGRAPAPLSFGVTWGGLFLGEPVTAGMLPGCLLVLAATALVTGFNPFQAAPPEP